MCCIGDNVGVPYTGTTTDVVTVQPAEVIVYVTVDVALVPFVTLSGQNWLPTTPVPDQVPPTGVPTRFTQGSDSQNGPKAVIVGITWYINTFKLIGVAGQLAGGGDEYVTDTPFVINPGAAADQLTDIELVPCPVVITPGAVMVQVYVPDPIDGTVYVDNAVD